MTTIRNSSLKSQRFLMSQTIGVTLLFFLPSTGNLVSFASPFPIDVPYYYISSVHLSFQYDKAFISKLLNEGSVLPMVKLSLVFSCAKAPGSLFMVASSYRYSFSHSLSTSFYLSVTPSYFLLVSVQRIQSLFLFLAQTFVWHQEVLTLWNLESTY